MSRYTLICDKCFKVMNIATSLKDLPCSIYEWEQDKDIFKKWNIYYCVECKRTYRTPKRLKYYLGKTIDFIKDGLKWIFS